MKKPKLNKFDLFVDKLIEGFSKLPNFDLTQRDELAHKLFNIVSYKIADISSYKELVTKHFIPATNKAVYDSKKDIENSKYRQYLDLKQIDFKETMYDTIRLSYVGLFHKLENYVNEVISVTEILFDEFYESEKTLNVWTKEHFDFNIRDWQQFNIVHKVNWVANCVKHRDSYPTKNPKPKGYQNINEEEKIRIDVHEFDQDCQLIISFLPIYLQLMFLFAQHKMFSEELNNNFDPEDHFTISQNERLTTIEHTLKTLIEQMRKI
ncbi:hypothetical protein ODZ84_04995 [Chryseobacterium fluminis]|uniref:hypothetical protein n=1 Tax=Chryseobacterium fluminis TaxID=2983606 RepID=UPI002255240C|nr:hypothetical protein [Chryseobacterium sp. MMS21-Ot14]UZT98930.1 hypothetical protein ODZ84_04995 [Chryseobacterium sp. MMS21-Ot14]